MDRAGFDHHQQLPMKADKCRIARAFARARNSYDLEAGLQRRVAAHLLTLLVHSAPDLYPEKVLEIGCCTGILTGQLVRTFPAIRDLHLNDLVADYVRLARPSTFPGQFHDHVGDVETLRIPGSFDLIISSSTLHWLHDLDVFFHKVVTMLAPGGVLAVALYGPENLREIRKLTGQGLTYYSLDRLVRMAERAGIQVLGSEQHLETLQFPGPRAVLSHLRATGVNALSRAGWTRTRLRWFLDQYRQSFSHRDRVVLTYHPVYLVGRGGCG